MSIRVLHADSRDALREMDAASVDACVTDPPYSLVSIVKRFGKSNAADVERNTTATIAGQGVNPYQRAARGFMGKKWDTGETAFDPAFWAEVLRVLKPGAHLIAFGGTRTYHRLVCAIEDAGFEIRDQLAWLFGSGFPKSHDVSKGIDRAAGAEREVVGEIPDRWTGAGGILNFATDRPQESVRVTGAPATAAAAQWAGWGSALKPAHEPICLARKPLIGTIAANVLAHGTGALNIDACRIETGEPWSRDNTRGKAKTYDGWGMQPNVKANKSGGRWPANVILDGSPEVLRGFPESVSTGGDGYKNSMFFGGQKTGGHGLGDSGSAARFFYTAKADAGDRLGSAHPTVKPVDLMAHLVKLITPPNGVVLDPFAGSGSTGMACMREGFGCILIERELEYVTDIRARIAHVHGLDAPLFAEITP